MIYLMEGVSQSRSSSSSNICSPTETFCANWMEYRREIILYPTLGGVQSVRLKVLRVVGLFLVFLSLSTLQETLSARLWNGNVSGPTWPCLCLPLPSQNQLTCSDEQKIYWFFSTVCLWVADYGSYRSGQYQDVSTRISITVCSQFTLKLLSANWFRRLRRRRRRQGGGRQWTIIT